MKRAIIYVKIIYYFLFSMKGSKNAALLSAKETAEKIAEKNLSVIRLGDGELNILLGKGITYQRYSKALGEDMRALIEEYMREGESCGYLLCMPNQYLNCGGRKLLKKRVWVASWAHFRYYFARHLDQRIDYGDAFLFSEKHEPVYKTIWAGKKAAVFVHHSEKYADAFQKRYDMETVFIKIPAKDAYAQKTTIIREIKAGINALPYGCDEIAVLISAGAVCKGGHLGTGQGAHPGDRHRALLGRAAEITGGVRV